MKWRKLEGLTVLRVPYREPTEYICSVSPFGAIYIKLQYTTT